MKKSLRIIVVAALLLSGCKAAQCVIAEEHEKIRIVTHTELIPVLATFKVPAASVERLVKDSSSHLETDFAKSDARINPDGSLYHSLENKEQTIPQEVEVEIEYRDTTIYKEKTVPVPVEKELTKGQKFRLNGFWVLLTLVLVGMVFKITKMLYGKR